MWEALIDAPRNKNAPDTICAGGQTFLYQFQKGKILLPC